MKKIKIGQQYRVINATFRARNYIGKIVTVEELDGTGFKYEGVAFNLKDDTLELITPKSKQPRQFVLLKDTPAVKKGAIYQYDKSYGRYECVSSDEYFKYPLDTALYVLAKEEVETQPEWFKELYDEVKCDYCKDNGFTYEKVTCKCEQKENIDIEKIYVTNLELSKRLKELGVKQDSLFRWQKQYYISEKFDNGVGLGKEWNWKDDKYEIIRTPSGITTSNIKHFQVYLDELKETSYSAFTVAELGEILPNDFVSGKYSWGKFCCWSESNIIVVDSIYEDKNETNTRAKMLIYLLENKLIKL